MNVDNFLYYINYMNIQTYGIDYPYKKEKQGCILTSLAFWLLKNETGLQVMNKVFGTMNIHYFIERLDGHTLRGRNNLAVNQILCAGTHLDNQFL